MQSDTARERISAIFKEKPYLADDIGITAFTSILGHEVVCDINFKELNRLTLMAPDDFDDNFNLSVEGFSTFPYKDFELIVSYFAGERLATTFLQNRKQLMGMPIIKSKSGEMLMNEMEEKIFIFTIGEIAKDLYKNIWEVTSKSSTMKIKPIKMPKSIFNGIRFNN
jgi:hypothetical protein